MLGSNYQDGPGLVLGEYTTEKKKDFVFLYSNLVPFLTVFPLEV